MAIIKTDAYFNSSTTVNKIHSVIWQDDTKTPIAILQIAHGLGEHMGRYEEFARFLAANGVIVCGNDHLGHGLSVDAMEDLGFTCEKDGDLRLVDDMHILYHIMHRRYPDLKYYLFGHSMGAACVRVFLSHFGHDVDGAILCGITELQPIARLSVGPVDKLTEKFNPHTKSKFLTEQLNAAMNRPFSSSARTPNDWLSSDEDQVNEIMADPLCNFPLSYALIRDIVHLQTECAAGDWVSRVPLQLPLMLIGGAEDPVGKNGRAVIDLAEKLEAAGHTPEVILYPGCRHNLLNETVRDKIFNDILIWLCSTLNAQEQAEEAPPAE